MKSRVPGRPALTQLAIDPREPLVDAGGVHRRRAASAARSGTPDRGRASGARGESRAPRAPLASGPVDSGGRASRHLPVDRRVEVPCGPTAAQGQRVQRLHADVLVLDVPRGAPPGRWRGGSTPRHVPTSADPLEQACDPQALTRTIHPRRLLRRAGGTREPSTLSATRDRVGVLEHRLEGRCVARPQEGEVARREYRIRARLRSAAARTAPARASTACSSRAGLPACSRAAGLPATAAAPGAACRRAGNRRAVRC